MVVVVGGGKAAEAKLKGLGPFNPHLRVIAPQFSPESLRLMALFTECEILYKLWDPADLKEAVLVYALTNDPEVNQAILAEGRLRGIPVNAGLKGTFRSPAAGKIDDWTLAVSSGGQHPSLARQARDHLLESLRSWLRQGR